MMSSIMNKKGQVTIPVQLRQTLGLRAGDVVAFEVKQGKIILRKQKDDITASFGLYKVPNKISLADIQRATE